MEKHQPDEYVFRDVHMWLYNGQPFTSADIGKNQGFVYIITDKINGKRYVGRKMFWFTKTLPTRLAVGLYVRLLRCGTILASAN